MSQDCGYARKRAEEETRMNKIYAWYPSMNGGLSTGHASLDISFGQGAPLADYVSWWPTRDVKLLTGMVPQPAQLKTFRADCWDEGGPPPLGAEIRCLDENRMRSRWTDIKARSNYSLYFRTCATTVVDVLCAGGADLSYDVRTYIAHCALWTPWDVIQLARLINTNASVIERQRNLGWKLEMSVPSFIDLERSGH